MDRRNREGAVALVAAAACALLLASCNQFSLYGDLTTAKTAPPAASGATSLTIQPLAAAVRTSGTFNFFAFGGATPYAFAVTQGSGTINAVSGAYTAPPSPGTAVVTVSDATGASSSANTAIVGPAQLTISPASLTLVAGMPYQFTATGGTAPYAYTIVSGGGSLSGGLYTAPAAAGSADIRVGDAVGATSDAAVSVVVPSPTGAVAISPQGPTVPQGGSITFTGSGGTPGSPKPYAYSITAGSGTINVNNGAYSAGGATIGSGTVTVTATDGVGSTASTTVNILPAAPSGLVATPLANRTIQLTWTNTATGAAGIIVEQTTDPAGTAFTQVASLSATATTYTTATLSPSSFYLYRLYTYQGSFNSPYSNQAFAISSP